MKTLKSILLITSTIICYSSFAQYNETIVSDRPGQSNAANTLGKMVLQVQTGPQFGGERRDNCQSNTFMWPAVIRFGIAEKVDLITVWGYESSKVEFFDQELTANGINTADLGLRFNIFEETAAAPALGFEAYYKTKMRSEDYRPENTSAKFNLMASKSLTGILSISTNLGVDFDGDGGNSEGFYTLNLAMGVTDELSLFFENYGFFGDDFDSYFDFGGGYLLNNNLQLDLYGGFGYNDDLFSFFVTGGVSYRITDWRKE